MPKVKTHKGLKKRIKVTATGKVAYKAPGKSHLNSSMSGQATRKKRKPSLAHKTVTGKLERVLHTHLKGTD